MPFSIAPGMLLSRSSHPFYPKLKSLVTSAWGLSSEGDLGPKEQSKGSPTLGTTKIPKVSSLTPFKKIEGCGKPTHGKSVSISVVYQLRWKNFKVHTDGK